MEKYEKVPLKELLEVIQLNLAFNIDSMYNQFKELIGKEKEHNLGWKKENLKKQIENYLKVIVKNIIFQIFNPNTNNWENGLNCSQIKIIDMLKEAIRE